MSIDRLFFWRKIGLSFLILLVWFSPVLAAPVNNAPPRAATFYDVAFAYARLTDTTPNFINLLSADRTWQALSPLEKAQTQNIRLNDLRAAFARFSVTEAPLVVQLPVRVHLSPEPMGLVLGYLSANLPYFPFWNGQDIVTLYTEDMPMLSILPVDDDLSLRRAGYLLEDKMTLYLDLMPSTKGQTRAPSRVDGEIQYLIPARIARIRLLNSGDTVIWDWTPPAYRYLYRTNLPRR